MPVRVPLEFANSSMHLARPICDGDGRLVAGAGTCLSTRVVRLLRTMAVQSVLVVEGEGIDQWQTVRPLDEELGELEARFASTPETPMIAELREAIRRRLVVRAERFVAEQTGDAPA
jgi:hypothetical protein